MKGIYRLMIMTACILLGCTTPPPAPPPAALPPPAAPPSPPAAPVVPLRPFTREIITLAAKNEVSIKNFQFYISETVSLENDKSIRRISHNSTGEVFLQDNSTRGQIVIYKETAGKLTNITTDGKFWTLEVRFDDNSNNPLFFRESEDGQRFELVYLETDEIKTLSFGGVEYVLTFTERPCLLIKLAKTSNSQPNRTILRGVYVDSLSEIPMF
jgi:hypothetical protein